MDSEAKAIAAYKRGEVRYSARWAQALAPLPPLEVRMRATQYKHPVVLSPTGSEPGELFWEQLKVDHMRPDRGPRWYVYAVREGVVDSATLTLRGAPDEQ